MARLKGESGFTLLEILIAVAIMSGLFIGLYTTFFSVSNAQVRIESELAQTRQLRRFMNVISTELRSAFYKKDSENTLFTGEARGRGGQERSTLGFTWFGYPRVGKKRRPSSGLIAVRYYVKEMVDEDGLSNAGVLYKARWNPYEGEDKGYEAEVMEYVEEFALSYFDGKDWVSGWEASNEKKLPVAVKVELTLRDQGRSQLYSSVVKLTLSDDTNKAGSL